MRLLWVALGLAICGPAFAATYTVGPSGTYDELADLPMLNGGDIVELERGATFMPADFFDPGDAGNPIVIRAAAGSGARPKIEGGTNTLQLGADHILVEGIEITGGSSRCVFVHGHDLTIRDVVIHGCTFHGIEGGGDGGGDLTLDHVEVYDSGEGTQHHQIYVSSDEVEHPGSRFRMQFCYVHDGNGGNNVKSRHERNEIYFNWIEGALYHELELIGPDPGDNDPEVPEDEAVENSDVVGNVLRKGGADSSFWITRMGGDGTGQTYGRYRFVNNTVILAADSSGVFRLFDGIDSLEAHNNVFYRDGAGTGRMVRDVETDWLTVRLIAGSNNWVSEDMTDVPTEWTGTVVDMDPMFENFGLYDLRPTMTSPLTDTGAMNLMGPASHPFPNPLAVPSHQPPPRILLAVGAEVARPAVGVIDRGAYEYGTGPPVMQPDMTGAAPAADLAMPGGADGGVTLDGSVMSDGSVSPDDAAGTGTPKDGCGCRVADETSTASALVLLLAVWIGLRPRRSVRGNGIAANPQ